MKYSSAALVNGIETFSWPSYIISSVKIQRFLTRDTQIQLKIICHELYVNSNEIQGQIKKDLKNEYEKTKVQINGRIGRIVGCIPTQYDASIFPNTSSSEENESLQFLWTTYYYNDILWKQMEQKTFKTVEVECEYAGELLIDENSNITGPEISREKAAELRQKFLNRDFEEITVNQNDSNRLQSVAKEMKIKLNHKKIPIASVLKKQTINQLRTWADGCYYIELSRPVIIDSNTPQLNVDVVVSMKNRHGGYITADEYPTFVFYGLMFHVYAFGTILWFILCALCWEDLLEIHFFIGGVILVSMIEHLAFFLQYNAVDKYGYNTQFAVFTTQIVLCLRCTILRMLVIIVAIDYGIVKPSLERLKTKLLAMSVLYFISVTTTTILYLNTENGAINYKLLLSGFLLFFVDLTTYYWIIKGLAVTTKILRLRENIIQLNIYQHFIDAIIYVIIASFLFMIWTFKFDFFTRCITNWRVFWFFDAFWHLLGLCILLVIMFLFRPSNINQLHVFVPLIDQLNNDNDDEEKGKSAVLDSVTIYNGTSTQDDAASKCEQQQQASVNYEANILATETEGSNGNSVVKDVLT
ncbi:unnamed protein product [Rotaria sp. Silwood1]|nr:unnamed protein product [Rotaria sp. Silwood1]CAF4835211.1 unnamed protein product [Rotaria sp. Silwood1]